MSDKTLSKRRLDLYTQIVNIYTRIRSKGIDFTKGINSYNPDLAAMCAKLEKYYQYLDYQNIENYVKDDRTDKDLSMHVDYLWAIAYSFERESIFRTIMDLSGLKHIRVVDSIGDLPMHGDSELTYLLHKTLKVYKWSNGEYRANLIIQ